MKNYRFYHDAGHGWLAVKRFELFTLGIADQISQFSYQHGDTVYLEEDCDLAKFASAKGWKPGDDNPITDKYDGSSSRIRRYEPYSYATKNDG